MLFRSAVTSANALVTVNELPAITAQPQSTTLCNGQTASFSVTATGTNLSYQWKKNGTNVGTNAASYSFTAGSGDNGATITVVVSGTCSPAVTSANAILTVNMPPVITAQPVTATLCVNGVATFSVVATGSPAPTYQWRKNLNNISGATSATLTIAAAQEIGRAHV